MLKKSSYLCQMEQKYDVIIIGAGIVGLATAYRLLQYKPDIRLCILEKEELIAKHQTGNNSGVIHSGIYYKPGGLRATNCRRGYKMLLEFCQEENIAYDVCGKIIVATQDYQLPLLDVIFERGEANGLQGLSKLDIAQLKEHEPHVQGLKGLWVPQAGIVDYMGVAHRLHEKILKAGGEVILGQKVEKVDNRGTQCELVTASKTYIGKLMINCAGLYSDKVALYTRDSLDMRILPFRGEYYKIKPEREYLVKNLIYPAPDPNFPWLGVHFTRMIKGGIEAGPNAVLAFRREGYKKLDINTAELLDTIAYKGFRKMAMKFWRQGMDEYYRSFFKSAFTRSLQTLIPELTEDDLIEGGAGVRALACGDDGALLDDFVFYEDKHVINVCNAPSPAATSCLSIGQTVAEMAMKQL